MAPSVTSLFMQDIEQSNILNVSINPFFSQLLCYRRFIGDIIIISSDAAKIETFVDWNNHVHEKNKFTWQADRDQVPFFDVIIYRTADDTLSVKPYRKRTDCNT